LKDLRDEVNPSFFAQKTICDYFSDEHHTTAFTNLSDSTFFRTFSGERKLSILPISLSKYPGER